MGLGTGNSNDKLLIVKPIFQKDGEKVKPYFKVTKKEGDKWEVDESLTPTKVWGDLVKIECVDDEYKKKKFKKVKIFLKDHDEQEVYLVDARMSLPVRFLLNNLFSLQDNGDLTDIEISLYQNDNGYGVASLRQKGEMVPSKYNKEEVPEPKEVIINGNKEYDLTEVDNFFAKEVDKFAKFVEENRPSYQSKSEDTKEDSEPVGATAGEDDDIPF